ncbi:helix-turn-helix transcriptional regulator [Actinosynnema sp. NPDC020468]|uniref:helix-turn-helix domain-containing protein n=1 Tax=Actinosynnema sp. NPDC020468 TaxID=3154488 RepID=UPI0033DF654F
MAQATNPVAQQRRLRTELRRARDRANRTQRDVAEELDWSTSKIIRIETGAVNISTTDLRALLAFYGEPAERIAELVEVAKASRQQAWWDKYKGKLSKELSALLELESATSLIRQFQTLVIPGLLQTEDYAREILRLYSREDELDFKVKTRLERQRLVLEEGGPKAFFVIDEAALRRWVGGPAVFRAQLEHLKELNRRPAVSIQVLTFDKGVHRGIRGNFEVFEFPDDQDHVVYLEWPSGVQVIQNDTAQASNFVEIFLELEGLAEPSDRLDAVIDRLLEEVPR